MRAVEPWHEHALRRIYEADRTLIRDGREPEPFRLRFTGESLDGEIEHRYWDRSWVVPSETTIDELGEVGVLRVEPSHGKARTFLLSVDGRAAAAAKFDPPIQPQAEQTPAPQGTRSPRKVAVMHGRDMHARRWMYDWLPRIGLEPLEWSHLVALTGNATPYSGEAVEAAFRRAQAVVVLFTPDEIGALHPELIEGDGSGIDERAAPQPRLNVVLEAGMALKSHEKETVLVEIGSTRPISDLAGRNTIRLRGDAGGLNELANRLERAGCPVDRSGTAWLETDELQQLAALRRKAKVDEVSAPPGGLAPVSSQGAFYGLLRARGAEIECRSHDRVWQDWVPVGAVDEEPIGLACASVGPVHAEVFALLPRGEVMHNWRIRGSWQPHFHSLGRPFAAEPVNRISAGSKGAGHQEVFVESAAGGIGHLWMEGRWRRNTDPATRLGDGWWHF